MAQCNNAINIFPYGEDFENSDGGWIAGGTYSDWAWGTPAKPVINSAASGKKCWMVGGLVSSSYADAEHSYLQSPCFNFSNVQYPYISFSVFWEMERKYDGAALQYSIDAGNNWQTVGSVNDATDCNNDNWYNNSIIYLSNNFPNAGEGWSGNIQPSSGSCYGGGGSGKWVTAKHIMPYLAGQQQVIFRFIFASGNICNNYDGFAIDKNIYWRNAIRHGIIFL